MKVTIPRTTEHEGMPFNLMTVEIDDKCPKCGEMRGKPYKTHSYDGSRRLTVDGWNNPCGHIDKYSELREK